MSHDTHLLRRHDIAFDGIVQTIPDSTSLFTADQMDFTLNVLLAFRNYLR
jgi:hypothetical protein